MSGYLSFRSRLFGCVVFSVLAAGLLALIPYLYPPIAFSATCGAIALFGIAAACDSFRQAVASERDLDDRIRAFVARSTAANARAIEPVSAEKLYVLTFTGPEPAEARAPASFHRRLAALERAGDLQKTESGYLASPKLMREFGMRPKPARHGILSPISL